ncbi:MAG: putative DNA binding domain-containing protein [Clostridia bacterium]|nr:putative DNA binding domain-containing protein [Clostridia bacterium]
MAELEELLQAGRGRTYCTEWEGNAPADFYENVCGLLNAFGGYLYIGIREDGTIVGMDEDKARELSKKLVQDLFDGKRIIPGFWIPWRKYLYVTKDGTLSEEPQGGKVVLLLYVPMSDEMHAVSRRIYDRTEDGNVDITDDGVALLHLQLRKSRENTELRPVPDASWEDLDLDTLHRMRDMAVATRPDHPWRDWEDRALLNSLCLVDYDRLTKESRHTLGALLLFGKDESLARLLPRYGIDLVLRSADGSERTERISCNLFKAYDRLMVFAHENISRYREADAAQAEAMDKVLRNLIVNFLVHREYTSPIPARLVISPDSISTENAHDAEGLGEVAPGFICAYPYRSVLNALLKAFREAGLVYGLNTGLDEIANNSGSLSAKPPVFVEGNTFRATVYM